MLAPCQNAVYPSNQYPLGNRHMYPVLPLYIAHRYVSVFCGFMNVGHIMTGYEVITFIIEMSKVYPLIL